MSKYTKEIKEFAKVRLEQTDNNTQIARDIINKGHKAGFNAGINRELGVVAKVKRGISFVGLNHSIGHSYTESATDFIQREIGRMTRLPINETAYVHILISYYFDKNGKKKYCQNKKWLDFIKSNTNLKLEWKYVNLNK